MRNNRNPCLIPLMLLLLCPFILGMYRPEQAGVWRKIDLGKRALSSMPVLVSVVDLEPPSFIPGVELRGWRSLGVFECTAYADGDGYTPSCWDGLVAYGEGSFYLDYRTRQINYAGWSTRDGWVAVDPTVIPMGSELYVEGYGYCEARDVGSAIKGRRLDLFFDDLEEMDAYGRQHQRVWIKRE